MGEAIGLLPFIEPELEFDFMLCELFIEDEEDELFIEEFFIELECIAPALGFGDAPLI